MAIAKQTMTDEQRKSVALEYFERLNKQEDIFDLFAGDAQAHYPKYGLANGIGEIRQLFGAIASIIERDTHDLPYLNYTVQGETVVVEGTSYGTLRNGLEWRTGATLGGRFCDVLEIRDFKIQRLFIYLDPDYGDEDAARYPWRARG